MLGTERRVFIMNMLNARSIVSLKDMVAELGTSEITVRRDLEKLENDGKLKRVPGGAALEGYLDSAEITMKQKSSINAQTKRLVAERASELAHSCGCVFLDGGTSIAPMIEFLQGRNITIVTYNQLVLRDLVNPAASIHVIGGRYLPHYAMNVGPEAQEQLQHYHFDAAFFGCAGVIPEQDMSFVTDLDSLLIKKIALENSGRKYLLLDDSKFDKPSFRKFVSLSEFDMILCNRSDRVTADERIRFV